MPSSAYQKILAQTAPPTAGVAGSGLQQAADSSVVGFNSIATATRPYQRVGATSAPVVGGFVQFDGAIP